MSTWSRPHEHFTPGVPVWADDVTIPDGTSPRNASSVSVPFEATLDRTAWCRANLLNGYEGGSYAPTAPIHVEGSGFEFNATLIAITDTDVTCDENTLVKTHGTVEFCTNAASGDPAQRSLHQFDLQQDRRRRSSRARSSKRP